MKLHHGFYFPDDENHFSSILDINEEYQYKSKSKLIAYLEKYPKKISQTIDVGANVGLWASWFKNVLKSPVVFCFEPSIKNYECLIVNCPKSQGYRNFKLALGDQESALPIYQNDHDGNTGDISLVKTDNSQILETIDIKKLDNFNFCPDIIKIDVQGYEKQVILGGELTIKHHRPIIIWEKDFKDIEVSKILTSWGYQESGFYTNSDTIWHFVD